MGLLLGSNIQMKKVIWESDYNRDNQGALCVWYSLESSGGTSLIASKKQTF